jgi:NAD(P)-dependent dehydrogenase (short-subunit alcohol dehydrogenase family)
MNPSGLSVLITGANRGLGTPFVEAAFDRDARRVYAGARDPATVPLFSDPDRVIGVPLEVTHDAAVRAAANTRCGPTGSPTSSATPWVSRSGCCRTSRRRR